MRLTRCRLRHCRCLFYGASVKLLEPGTLMRHSGITLLSSYLLCCFWLALVFPLLPVLLWQKVRQVRIELTALRLWNLHAATCAFVAVLLWCISENIGALYVDAAFRSNTVVWLYSVLLLVGSGFSPPVCITVSKSATSEERTHDLKIMRLTRCRQRHCCCLLYGASVKLLEPCTLMRHSGITLLSSCLLCCFWLALISPLLPVLLWQKVRQVRIELTTVRLWDLRAADCAIVAVSFMAHQWSYWSLERWCGIPE